MKPQLITRISQIDRRWPIALLGLLIVVQLFIPLMSAASSVKSEDGQYVVVCTLQGLQQVLLSDDGVAGSQDNSSHQGPTDCPLCSLTNLYMSALSTLSPDTPKDPSQQGYPLPENDVVVIDRLVYATPARAPPIV